MRIAVFCGSSTGSDPVFIDQAKALGKQIAEDGHSLVYGGGNVGLMGIIADEVMDRGGKVVGVIPRLLKEREVAHEDISELFIVDDMHARKAKMAALSDAFVAMPGGAGTLEEIFEVWTWAQLGYHEKPCGFLNVEGYFDPLLTFIDSMCDKQFLKPIYRAMLLVSDSPAELLASCVEYEAPQSKWR